MKQNHFLPVYLLIISALACSLPGSIPAEPTVNPLPPPPVSQPTVAPPPVNPTSVPASSSISGIVWHDLCALPTLGGLPSPLPAGCVPSGDTAEANSLREPGEPGIPGIQVNLHQGGCDTAVMANRLTDQNGYYSFEPISETGAFCITVNPLAPPNDSILIPGGWTYPSKGASSAQTIVQLSAGTAYQVDFGWDFKFLP